MLSSLDTTRTRPDRTWTRSTSSIVASILVVGALVVGCEAAGTREVHDLVIDTGNGREVVRWVYGSADTVRWSGTDVAVGDRVGDDVASTTDYAVASARTVDGRPFARLDDDEVRDEAFVVSKIPFTTDVRVVATRTTFDLRYFDGRGWFSLADEIREGRRVDVAPVPSYGRLRGFGALTVDEADALADAVERDGQAWAIGWTFDAEAVSEEGRPSVDLPDGGDGPEVPVDLDAYRVTVAWAQEGVTVDESAYQAPATRLVFDTIASGTQGADPRETRFLLIDDDAALRALWSDVYVDSLTPPPIPEVDWARETIVAVRREVQPTAGYGVAITGATVDEGDLYVDVAFTDPPDGALSATVLTTPWTVARVLGIVADVVWFQDADGSELIGVARRGDGR